MKDMKVFSHGRNPMLEQGKSKKKGGSSRDEV